MDLEQLWQMKFAQADKLGDAQALDELEDARTAGLRIAMDILAAPICQYPGCNEPISPCYRDWQMCEGHGHEAQRELYAFQPPFMTAQEQAEEDAYWAKMDMEADNKPAPYVYMTEPEDPRASDDDDQMAPYQNAYDNRPLYKD